MEILWFISKPVLAVGIVILVIVGYRAVKKNIGVAEGLRAELKDPGEKLSSGQRAEKSLKMRFLWTITIIKLLLFILTAICTIGIILIIKP